jgi:flagellar assembly protein FliH
MTDRAIAILRGLAVVGEPRPLTRPAVQARSRAEVEIIEVPSLAAMPAAPPAIDPAELARLRDAAFREGLEQGRAKGFEEGRQQGFKQGLGEGQQEGEAAVRAAARAGQERLDFLTERLEQWLALLPDHFQEQLAQRLKAAEDDMVALCHAVISRFLGEKALGREVLVHAVRSAVAECCGANAHAATAGLLAIHVNPGDLEIVQADPGLTAWLSRLRAGPIPWRADEAVGPGGCVVHSTHGSLDARLETQLAALQLLLVGGRATPTAEGGAR